MRFIPSFRSARLDGVRDTSFRSGHSLRDIGNPSSDLRCLLHDMGNASSDLGCSLYDIRDMYSEFTGWLDGFGDISSELRRLRREDSPECIASIQTSIECPLGRRRDPRRNDSSHMLQCRGLICKPSHQPATPSAEGG